MNPKIYMLEYDNGLDYSDHNHRVISIHQTVEGAQQAAREEERRHWSGWGNRHQKPFPEDVAVPWKHHRARTDSFQPDYHYGQFWIRKAMDADDWYKNATYVVYELELLP